MRRELLTRLAEEIGGAALPFRVQVDPICGPWLIVSWGFQLAPWATLWTAAKRLSLLGLN